MGPQKSAMTNSTPTAPVTVAGTISILVCRFTELGNVAMTIPALYDACAANAGTTFVILTLRNASGLFINRPANLAVESVEPAVYRSFKGMWHTFVELNSRYQFTAFVDLQNSGASKVMRIAARMHGVRSVHVDKGLGEKKRLTRRTGKLMLPLTPTTERYRDAIARVSSPVVTRRFRSLFDTVEAEAGAYAGITATKAPGEVWIGIAPFAKHEGKIYPLQLMEQVVRDLSSRHNTTIFLCGGGPYEQKILTEWARKYPSTHSLAGRRDGLSAELSLFNALDVMVTMDSANMHMAALAGAPVVAIWGATHHYCGYGGWMMPEENNIQLPIPCRPCSVSGDRRCLNGDRRCMTGITPALIISRINSVLHPVSR